MGEDRALDEFLGGDDDAGERDEAPTDAGDEEDVVDDGGKETDARVDGEVDADDDPEAGEAPRAVSMTAFTPEGAACESCGASVRRRWRDDGALVCADCKAW